MTYINQGNGPALFGLSVAALAITTIFFSIRIYVRCFLVRIWKAEDWFFLASQILFVMFITVFIMSAIHGNGQHRDVILDEDVPVALKYWYIGELFYVVDVLFIRMAIAFFLLRVAAVKKGFLRSIYITIGVSIVITVIYFFFLTFQCNPVQHFWQQFRGAEGTCLTGAVVRDVSIAQGAVGAVVDLIFAILPMFLIWNLKMVFRTKLVAMVLLSLGIVAAITVLVRIYYVSETGVGGDFLYTTSNVALWSVIEPAVGICCAAASTFRPLFKSFQEKSSHNAGSRTHGLTARSGNSTFRSNRIGPRNGYLTSNDSASGFEEDTPLGNLGTKGFSIGEISAGSERRSSPVMQYDGKGIVYSRTVEVSREERVAEDLV